MPVLCSIKSVLNAKKGMNLFTLCFFLHKNEAFCKCSQKLNCVLYIPYGSHSGLLKVTMLP